MGIYIQNFLLNFHCAIIHWNTGNEIEYFLEKVLNFDIFCQDNKSWVPFEYNPCESFPVNSTGRPIWLLHEIRTFAHILGKTKRMDGPPVSPTLLVILILNEFKVICPSIGPLPKKVFSLKAVLGKTNPYTLSDWFGQIITRNSLAKYSKRKVQISAVKFHQSWAMEFYEDQQKRINQVTDLFDRPDSATEKVLQLYNSLGKYYDQVYSSSGGSRIYSRGTSTLFFFGKNIERKVTRGLTTPN